MAMFRNAPGSPISINNFGALSNATADVNGDTNLDLLFSNGFANEIVLLLGDGKGGFANATSFPASNASLVVTGDIDGDGDVDFVATNQPVSTVTLGINDGTGTFDTSKSVTTGSGALGLWVGDFDGDNDLDLVSLNYNDATVSLHLNNGDATFQPGKIIVNGYKGDELVVADLDGDNNLDIGISDSRGNPEVSIFLNDGLSNFTAIAPVPTEPEPHGTISGDVNGDGNLDLIVGKFEPAGTVSVFLGDGSGGFALNDTVNVQDNPYDIQLGDLDMDGDLDMVVTNSGSDTLSVFLNDGTGTFTELTGSPILVGPTPAGVTLGDFDKDGDLDLSTVNYSGTTSILLNTSAIYSVAATAPTSAAEGTAPGAGGQLVFTISRTASSEAESVTYTLGGTADSADFTDPLGGTVSFVAGQQTATVTLSITPDATFEADETVVLTLTGVTTTGDAVISATDNKATGTILNDDFGSIGDRVWNDLDGDGVQDAGESGVAGLTVTLSDGVGSQTTTTDASGNYTFANLKSGNYTVSVTPPVNGTQTFDLDGLGTANKAGVTLGDGEHRTDVDFGYRFGNTAPTISALGPSVTTDEQTPVVLDANVDVSDPELDAGDGGAGNYAGAVLTIKRAGGANSDDQFTFTASTDVNPSGADIVDGNGDVYATFTASGGTLTITFTGADRPATSALVDAVLRAVTYTNGSDGPPASVTLDYTFDDGNSGAQGSGPALTGTGSITVTINPVNDAVPVSKDDSYSVNEDTKLTITAPGVLGNDSDIDGDTMTVAVVAGPANGTLTLNPDGSFDYTPNADFHGTDSFSYKANDGTGNGNTATVTLTVNPVNDALPVSKDDSYSTNEDTKLTVTTPGVLGNDSDVDGDTMTVAVVSAPANGTLTLNPDGSFDYTPNADFSGTDSFTYKANDGTGDGNTATVTLTVNPVNDAPVSVDDLYATSRDTPLVVTIPGLLGNDSDIDGDTLTAMLVAAPANGTLTLNPDGSFTYTPAAGYVGADSFTYKTNDGTVDGNTATVRLTVTTGSGTGGGNQPAVFTGDVLGRVVEAGTASPGIPTASGALLVDDPDGPDTLQPIVAGTRSVWGYGTVEMTRDGVWTYTLDNTNPTVDRLATGETLTDRFVALAADGTQQVIVITITGADDGRAIIGTPQPDTLTGTPDDDVIRGLAGRDTLTGGAGDDTIDGGRGLDTALFSGDLAGYRLTRIDERTVEIVDIDPSDGDDGTDILSSIEMLRFGGADPVTIGSLAGQPDWTLERDDVGVTAATYQLFLHGVPAAGGFDYLVMSDVNTTDLNDPYYFIFNLENRYLNFASNLGTASPQGAAWFDTEYGALTYEQAVEKAFAAIVSADALRAIGADPAVAIDFFMDGRAFFEAVAAERVVRPGVDLTEATKIVMLGSMLYEAVKANVGSYGQAVNDFADIIYASGTHEDLGGNLFEVA